jgi:3-phenylpropionate/trans-cinnamate dioxygenase ferredoxin subunit
MAGWHKVGNAADITPDEPLGVEIADLQIGIFRVDDALYAIEDVCPHAYALLSQGFVDGDEVECPLHGAIFQISSGKCLLEPAERDLKTYKVKLEGDDVLVEV